MNIRKHMLAHEKHVGELLIADPPGYDWSTTLAHHQRLVHDMQHERLIHLLVTLAFALFLILTTGYAFFKPCNQTIALPALFLIMLVPYIAHYFFLENTIQRWYQLTGKLETKCSPETGPTTLHSHTTATDHH